LPSLHGQVGEGSRQNPFAQNLIGTARNRKTLADETGEKPAPGRFLSLFFGEEKNKRYEFFNKKILIFAPNSVE